MRHPHHLLATLCFVTAAVMFFLLFATSVLDGSYLFCALGLVAAGLVVDKGDVLVGRAGGNR